MSAATPVLPSTADMADLAWLGEGLVLVVGASGGVGQALFAVLQARLGAERVRAASRHTEPRLDLLDEASVAAAAQAVSAWAQAQGQPLRLVIDATGFLHGQGFEPEKALRQLDPAHMAHAFAVNAIGPALLMKHLLPLLPRQGRSVFATLSAKVGSIGDNRLGGWHSYRASKAALNQLVRTAAIELARSRPQALCVALHPGTVDTGLSQPFAKTGLTVRSPAEAAERLLGVMAGLPEGGSGGFFDSEGRPLPW
ncbi:SDR family NAD(P)-dependent oxidoreductase [Aquabacterium sp.]|uniref:SDR family oxidoreductase n=1 Tax=Aquabacterium sp. TaxID=1872578 RepID=UPI0025BC8F98|nr:SDR family NAD(P)-dependent oxidoreductase [Aquabacterium sp.]